jgi:uncharacterized protein (TIGR03382 family)
MTPRLETEPTFGCLCQRLLVLGALTCSVWTHGAAPSAVDRALQTPGLSPAFAFAWALRTRAGDSEFQRLVLGDSVTNEGVRVFVTFPLAPTAADLLRLEQTCPMRRLGGQPAVVGTIAEVRCPWSAVPRMADWLGSGALALAFDRRPTLPAPPNQSTSLEQTRVQAVNRQRWPDGITGRGVVIADFDTGVDVFHPALFHADGGSFRWLDVDGNGQFDPGLDAVDLNRNGVADPTEVLAVLEAGLEPGFQVGIDWLYVDENGSGAREFGARPPWGDGVPTFGEQLFLVDDVDRDGVLEPGEPVVALKTSKVRAIALGQRIFRRGVDLSSYQAPHPVFHASMVLGTLGGGDARLSLIRGVAPDAEFVVVEHDQNSPLAGAAWARAEGASIFLWEIAEWTGDPLDGSSAHQRALDQLHAEGLVQVAAAGNLGTSEKHARVTVAAGSSQAMPFAVSAGRHQGAWMTLLWRTTDSMPVSLGWGAESLALDGPGGQGTIAGVSVQWFGDVSNRGTSTLNVIMMPASGRALPGGAPTVSVTNAGLTPVEVDGYLMDGESGWGVGVRWTNPMQESPAHTVGTPAVSDKTLAVGAWFADDTGSGRAGALAAYSSRGPRPDGRDTIDVVSPSDVWTIPSRGESRDGSPGYAVGSGTSNSTPVAVGVLALLKQALPEASPDELVARLRRGARADAFTGSVPNDAAGHGKADAWRSLFEEALSAGEAPVARGSAVTWAGVLELDASPSTGGRGPLRYRWDFGADGVFDVGPTSDGKVVLTEVPADVRPLRLEVADANGATSAALIEVRQAVTVPTATIEGPAAKTGCGCGATTLEAWLAFVLVLQARRRRAAG